MRPRRRRARSIVAGHWWPADYDGPPLVSFDAGLAQGWGVHVGDTHPGERARPRHRPDGRQPARHRTGRRCRSTSPWSPAPGCWSMRRTPISRRCGWPRPDQGALLRAVTDALPNVTGIRRRGRAGRGCRAAWPDRRGAGRDRIADARRPERWCWWARSPPDSGGAGRGGDPEDPRRHPRARSGRRGWWSSACSAWRPGCWPRLVGTAASLGGVALHHARGLGLPARHPGGDAFWALAMMLVFGYAGTAAALRAKPAPLLRNE